MSDEAMSIPTWRPSALAEEICDLFGLQPDLVTNLTLHMPPHEVPTLVVEYNLWERGGDVVRALRSYELRESAVPASGGGSWGGQPVSAEAEIQEGLVLHAGDTLLVRVRPETSPKLAHDLKAALVVRFPQLADVVVVGADEFAVIRAGGVS